MHGRTKLEQAAPRAQYPDPRITWKDLDFLDTNLPSSSTHDDDDDASLWPTGFTFKPPVPSEPGFTMSNTSLGNKASMPSKALRLRLSSILAETDESSLPSPGERKLVVLVARMKRGATTDMTRRPTTERRYPPFLAELLRTGKFGGLFLNAIKDVISRNFNSHCQLHMRPACFESFLMLGTAPVLPTSDWHDNGRNRLSNCRIRHHAPVIWARDCSRPSNR